MKSSSTFAQISAYEFMMLSPFASPSEGWEGDGYEVAMKERKKEWKLPSTFQDAVQKHCKWS